MNRQLLKIGKFHLDTCFLKKQNKQKHSGNTEQTSPGGSNCLDLSSRWDTIKAIMTTAQTFEFVFPGLTDRVTQRDLCY